MRSFTFLLVALAALFAASAAQDQPTVFDPQTGLHATVYDAVGFWVYVWENGSITYKAKPEASVPPQESGSGSGSGSGDDDGVTFAPSTVNPADLFTTTAIPTVNPADLFTTTAIPTVNPADLFTTTAIKTVNPADLFTTTAIKTVNPADLFTTTAISTVNPADLFTTTAISTVNPADLFTTTEAGAPTTEGPVLIAGLTKAQFLAAWATDVFPSYVTESLIHQLFNHDPNAAYFPYNINGFIFWVNNAGNFNQLKNDFNHLVTSPLDFWGATLAPIRSIWDFTSTTAAPQVGVLGAATSSVAIVGIVAGVLACVVIVAFIVVRSKKAHSLRRVSDSSSSLISSKPRVVHVRAWSETVEV